MRPIPGGLFMAFDVRKIESEVEYGLPKEQSRLLDAKLASDYYNGVGSQYLASEEDGGFPFDQLRKMPKRASLITQRVTNVLSDLYASRPSRTLANSTESNAWLMGVYKDNAVDSLFADGDKIGHLMDFAAIQPVGTDDPRRPVKQWLWGADELAVFRSDDDPTLPVAVVTIARHDEQTTYTLYTADEVRTYKTKQLLPGQTAGGRVAQLVSAEPNPYGVLPFSFIHFERPTRTFDTPSIGTPLRKANEYLDVLLNEMSSIVRAYGRPELIGYNLPADWAPTSRIGDILAIPAQPNASNEGNGPRIEYAQPELDFQGIWENYCKSVEQVLVDLGVPISIFRGEANSTQSGIALQVEQSSLLLRQQRRRLLFQEFEESLARLTLLIGGIHWSRPDLVAASEDLKLTVEWPEPRIPIPDSVTQAKELSDIEIGASSLTKYVQKMLGCTEPDAEAHLVKVAKQRKWEATLLGKSTDVLPLATSATTGEGGELSDAALQGLANEEQTPSA